MSESAKAGDRGLTIQILGREFRVGCPDGEEKQLLASVDYLNRKLREVRDTGKVVGNERIAIMAALNIAHELLSNRPNAHGFDASAFRGRIEAMQEALDTALAADQENLF